MVAETSNEGVMSWKCRPNAYVLETIRTEWTLKSRVTQAVLNYLCHVIR